MSSLDEPQRLERLDAIGEAFEDDWRAGRAPDLAAYLARVADDERSALFRELLLVEIELRRAGGQVPSEKEYCERFLDHSDLVRAAFADAPTAVRGPMSPLSPPVPSRFGPYDLLEPIGKGGMGRVYKARHRDLGRLVALKVLGDWLRDDADAVERFRREVRAAAALHHTNIVPVYEVGAADGVGFYAMQLIDGRGLDVLIGELQDREHPLSATERRAHFRLAAQVGYQAARALAHAHAHGVVHRDIKPSNLLLDTFGTLWIADFGLAYQPEARAQGEPTLTQTGSFVGTLRYMAPERFQGVSEAAGDVYALGATLYELLTLRPAFDETDPARLMDAVAHREPTRPRLLEPLLPADLETVVLKAMDKEPTRRYATADDLADDLQRFLRDEPVRARRSGIVERFCRWCRREPRVAGPTVAAGLLLLVLLVGAAAAALSLDRARRRAETLADEKATALETTDRALHDSRDRLVRQHLATGRRHADAGEPWLALLWFAHAWRNDRADSLRDADHRLRLGALLEELPVLEGVCFHRAPVEQATLAADGRRLLTRTDGPEAFLWDPSTGTLVAPLQHDGVVCHLAFAPDGTVAVTTSDDRTARLWDAATGALTFRLAHPATVRWAAFRTDGTAVATACADGRVRLWDTTHGRLHKEISVSSSAALFVVFSSDGGRLLTLDGAGVARIWDAADGRALSPPLPHPLTFAPRGGPQESVPQLARPAFLADGRGVVTVDGSRLLLWEGEPRFVEPWPAPIGHAEVSPLRDRYFIANRSDTARLASFSKRPPLDLKHPRQVVAGRLRPDGRVLATTSSGGPIHFWDCETGQPTGVLLRHGHNVTCLEFSADGRRLLAAGRDGTARVWRLAAEPPGPRPYDFADGAAHRVGAVPSPGGGMAAYSPAGDREVRFGSGVGARLAARGAAEGPTIADDEVLKSAFFSGDGRRVVTLGPTWLRVWEASGALFGRPIPTSAGRVFASADATRLATVDAAGVVEVWDVEKNDLLFRIIPETSEPPPGPAARHTTVYRGRTSAFALSPDGRRLILHVGGVGGQIYDVDAGTATLALPSLGLLASAAFSEDSRRLAVGFSDDTARLWSVARGEPVGPPLRHPSFVRRVALSPDGVRVATFAADGRLRLWNGETGDLLLTRSSDRAPRLWFGADGHTVSAVAPDAPPRQWTLPTFTLPAAMTPDLMRLLTGQEIDATEGAAFVPERAFMEEPERYRRAWLAWRKVAPR